MNDDLANQIATTRREINAQKAAQMLALSTLPFHSTVISGTVGNSMSFAKGVITFTPSSAASNLFVQFRPNFTNNTSFGSPDITVNADGSISARYLIFDTSAVSGSVFSNVSGSITITTEETG